MIHKYAYGLSFTSSEQRLAFVPAESDVGKVAKQLDDGAYWVLHNHSPVEWSELVPETKRASTFQKLTTIFEKIVYPVPATPDFELFDEEINLGAYARFAHTNMVLISWAVEKQVGGEWVATPGGPNYTQVWDDPAPEPEGYEAYVSFLCGPKDRPFCAPERKPVITDDNPDIIVVGSDTGRDVFGKTFSGGWLGIKDGESRMRLWCKRSSRVYTPEEQAVIDANQYRIRVMVQVKDLCVWEKEVPIPLADDAWVMQEDIDVSDFGLTGEQDTHVWVVEFRRDGKTIRGHISREYREGEQFDPPAPPVGIIIRPFSPVGDWRAASDSERLWGGERYGLRANASLSWKSGLMDAAAYYPDEYQFMDSVWVGGNGGYCNSPNVQKTAIRIRRRGALKTTYADGSDYVPGTLDLSTVGTGNMQGILITAPGVLAPVWPPSTNAIVRFFADSVDGTHVTTNGVDLFVHFQPGVSTLQQVWDGIAALDPHVCNIRVGTLTNPNYVMQAGDEDDTGGYGWNITGHHFTQVPVPPEPNDLCTVRVRLMASPSNLVNKQYPWYSGLFDPDTRVENLDDLA